MNLIIRRAIADDVPVLEELEYEAFKVYRRPDCRAHAHAHAIHGWSRYYLMEDGGIPIATAEAVPHALRVGRCTIMKVDVGHVAVRPERQGQGVGTHLMKRLLAILPQAGFHCSRLGGLMRFYRRFGYEPFPRRYVQIEIQPLSAVLKGIPWAEILGVPPELAVRVRPYHPHRDHAAHQALMQAFNAGRTGWLVETAPEAPPAADAPIDPLRLVYEVDGNLRGFLHGHVDPVHAGQPPAYQIGDLAVDFACPEAVGVLVKTFLQQAAATAPTVVSCRLPYDERLFDLLNAAGINFDVVEMRQGFDGNMMQVLALPALLRAIAPELDTRLATAGCCPWEGNLALVLPGQEAVLRVAASGVTVSPAGPADSRLELGHATLLKWVLGLCSPGEFPWLTRHLTGPQRVTLGILFPREPTYSGPWG